MWKWIEANVDLTIGRQVFLAGGRSHQAYPIGRYPMGCKLLQKHTPNAGIVDLIVLDQ
jgi:hypothetical protein